MTEADEIWDRLKYGPFTGLVIVNCVGNGTACCFNSSWISDAMYVRVFVDDVAQSEYRDFRIEVNTVIFNQPPAHNASIDIEAHGQKD